jgi:hypothetical protein
MKNKWLWNIYSLQFEKYDMLVSSIFKVVANIITTIQLSMANSAQQV